VKYQPYGTGVAEGVGGERGGVGGGSIVLLVLRKDGWRQVGRTRCLECTCFDSGRLRARADMQDAFE